jgi:hypothetical protein
VLLAALIFGVGAYLSVRQRLSPDLKTMYVNHRWLDLRDAVMNPPKATFGRSYEPPAFYKAAVEYAFPDFSAAEKLAREAIRSARDPFETRQAHFVLQYVYFQEGRYAEQLSEIQVVLPEQDSDPDLKSDVALDTVAMRLPRQSVAQRGFSKVSWTAGDAEDRTIPASINGHPAHYQIDTGDDLSDVSDAEAGRLGLSVYDAPGYGIGEVTAAQYGPELRWWTSWRWAASGCGCIVPGDSRPIFVGQA